MKASSNGQQANIQDHQANPNKKIIACDVELVKIAQTLLKKENKSLKKRLDAMQSQMKDIFEIIFEENILPSPQNKQSISLALNSHEEYGGQEINHNPMMKQARSDSIKQSGKLSNDLKELREPKRNQYQIDSYSCQKIFQGKKIGQIRQESSGTQDISISNMQNQSQQDEKAETTQQKKIKKIFQKYNNLQTENDMRNCKKFNEIKQQQNFKYIDSQQHTDSCKKLYQFYEFLRQKEKSKDQNIVGSIPNFESAEPSSIGSSLASSLSSPFLLGNYQSLDKNRSYIKDISQNIQSYQECKMVKVVNSSSERNLKNNDIIFKFHNQKIQSDPIDNFEAIKRKYSLKQNDLRDKQCKPNRDRETEIREGNLRCIKDHYQSLVEQKMHITPKSNNYFNNFNSFHQDERKQLPLPQNNLIFKMSSNQLQGSQQYYSNQNMPISPRTKENTPNCTNQYPYECQSNKLKSNNVSKSNEKICQSITKSKIEQSVLKYSETNKSNKPFDLEKGRLSAQFSPSPQNQNYLKKDKLCNHLDSAQKTRRDGYFDQEGKVNVPSPKGAKIIQYPKDLKNQKTNDEQFKQIIQKYKTPPKTGRSSTFTAPQSLQNNFKTHIPTDLNETHQLPLENKEKTSKMLGYNLSGQSSTLLNQIVNNNAILNSISSQSNKDGSTYTCYFGNNASNHENHVKNTVVSSNANSIDTMNAASHYKNNLHLNSQNPYCQNEIPLNKKTQITKFPVTPFQNLNLKRQKSNEESLASKINKYSLKLNLTSLITPKSSGLLYSDRQVSERTGYSKQQLAAGINAKISPLFSERITTITSKK